MIMAILTPLWLHTGFGSCIGIEPPRLSYTEEVKVKPHLQMQPTRPGKPVVKWEHRVIPVSASTGAGIPQVLRMYSTVVSMTSLSDCKGIVFVAVLHHSVRTYEVDLRRIGVCA
jgi:hypothetical protein